MVRVSVFFVKSYTRLGRPSYQLIEGRTHRRDVHSGRIIGDYWGVGKKNILVSRFREEKGVVRRDGYFNGQVVILTCRL
jgi:hypothetical protein